MAGLSSVELFTDGACSGNPGPGGYGAILVDVTTGTEKKLSGGFRDTTNNRMELLAVIVGLEALKEACEVIVTSDSKYVVDSVEKNWVFGWEKKDFKDRKNSDLWKRFLKVYRKHKVTFVWVRGHNDHPMNERCDKLAVKARLKPNLPKDRAI